MYHKIWNQLIKKNFDELTIKLQYNNFYRIT